jgi:hypothetical protein
MTNLEAVERFDQSHGATIEQLFWIAGSMNNSDLKDLIERLEDKEWKELFPDIYYSDFFQEYLDDSEEMQALVDFRKFGLIAEIHLPECRNFTYKDNRPVSWSVHRGISIIRYTYAETLEELMSEVEKVSEKVFHEYIEKDKNKSIKPTEPNH